MKQDIHPTYYDEAVVTCACGNSFVTGSTLAEIRTELCNKCHPFYTGTQRLVDTARRVEKFEERTKKQETASDRKGKKVKKAAIKAKKAAKKDTETKSKKTSSEEK
jgi:large subunit ribosomal protein L31